MCTCLRFYFSQMWRFPVFDDVRKWWLDFLLIEGEPAQLSPGNAISTPQACALGTAPNRVDAPEKIFELVESWA